MNQKEITSIAEKALDHALEECGIGTPDKDYLCAAEELASVFLILEVQEDPYALLRLDRPPTTSDTRLHRVTMFSGGLGGGRSLKPSNLVLHLGKLMEAVASGTLSIAGVTAVPWLMPFAAIVIWSKASSQLSVDIAETDAAVLWTLWRHRDQEGFISGANLLAKVNAELQAHSRSPLPRARLDESLQLLEKLRCIKASEAETDAWWLRESVRIKSA